MQHQADARSNSLPRCSADVVDDDIPRTEVLEEPRASKTGAVAPSASNFASFSMLTGTDSVDTGEELAVFTTDVSIGVTTPGAVGTFKLFMLFLLVLISLVAFPVVTGTMTNWRLTGD